MRSPTMETVGIIVTATATAAWLIAYSPTTSEIKLDGLGLLGVVVVHFEFSGTGRPRAWATIKIPMAEAKTVPSLHTDSQ